MNKVVQIRIVLVSTMKKKKKKPTWSKYVLTIKWSKHILTGKRDQKLFC